MSTNKLNELTAKCHGCIINICDRGEQYRHGKRYQVTNSATNKKGHWVTGRVECSTYAEALVAFNKRVKTRTRQGHELKQF